MIVGKFFDRRNMSVCYSGTSPVIARQISFGCKSREKPECRRLSLLLQQLLLILLFALKILFTKYIYSNVFFIVLNSTFKAFEQIHFKPRFHSHFFSKVVFRPVFSPKRFVGRLLFAFILCFIYKPGSIPGGGPNRRIGSSVVFRYSDGIFYFIF